MNKNKQLLINMFASMFGYIVTMGICFFLSPYIVKNIGVDAYGFIGLANNFITYAGLLTIALNSLAGRFVTMKIYENDIKGANKYFSSVFISNSIIAILMGSIFVVILLFLECIINIPTSLYWDVKILFVALFTNCLLGTIGSVYKIATFATNRLFLDSLRQIEANIIKVVLIVILFRLFTPRVCYVGIATLITGMYIFLFDVYYTKKLLPNIQVNKEAFDLKAVWEIFISGVWNLITRLGQVLLDELDLLITNIFISATSMGVLSIAKIIPTAITGIVANLVNVFSPCFTILYAENKIEELLKTLKQSMKIMGIIANIPIVILIVCGEKFFSLWQPSQDANQLQLLAILSCAGLIFSGGINCIFDIFTVVNKLKINAVVVVFSGVVNTVIVYFLLKTSDLGVYAVAGVSTSLAIFRNLFFTVPYGAICLKQKWYTFYPAVLRPVIFVGVSSGVCYMIENIFLFEGWFDLILLVAITVCISVIIGFFIILNQNDRIYLINLIKKRGKI